MTPTQSRNERRIRVDFWLNTADNVNQLQNIWSDRTTEWKIAAKYRQSAISSSLLRDHRLTAIIEHLFLFKYLNLNSLIMPNYNFKYLKTQ